jgi:type II secretory pathway pseudopilin PulG
MLFHRKKTKIKGFSLVEVLIASIIAFIAVSAIVFFLYSAKGNIGKTTDLLRASEIAQETLDIIKATPLTSENMKKLEFFNGSLVDFEKGESINWPSNVSGRWPLLNAKYPEQYNKACFYRIVRFEELPNTSESSRFLVKVVIDIFWNTSVNFAKQIKEKGKKLTRNRKYSLAAILIKEKGYY